MNANSNTRIALAISIALTATPQEVEAIIADIRDQFGINDANSVDPAELNQRAIAMADAAIAPQQAGNHAPTVTANTELDSAGIPWDSRIHSSSKGQNKDGTWRGRKGVDKGLVERVTAELKATMNATPATPATAPTLAAPPAAAPPSPPAMPAMPSMPAPPSPPAPVADPRYTAFVDLALHIRYA